MQWNLPWQHRPKRKFQSSRITFSTVLTKDQSSSSVSTKIPPRSRCAKCIVAPLCISAVSAVASSAQCRPAQRRRCSSIGTPSVRASCSFTRRSGEFRPIAKLRVRPSDSFTKSCIIGAAEPSG